MLSQRTRYAIRALLHLADRHGEGPIHLPEIAQAQNIPAGFLTVILSQLSRAGLVTTTRGKDGGYRLARAPDRISFGDVIRLTRGSLALVPCASRQAHRPCENCVDQERCRIHHVMLEVRDETARILDNVTLADRAHAIAAD